jgi:hypothetical protein
MRIIALSSGRGIGKAKKHRETEIETNPIQRAQSFLIDRGDR